MTKLDTILKEIEQQIPGFLSISVVGLDGLSIAVNCASDFDYETANAQFALVMKLLSKTANQLGKKSIDDFLVTTEHAYLLTRLVGDGSFWFGIAIDRNAGTLGNMRLVAKQFADEVWAAIPKRRK
ncbi:hypothetical protein GF337_11600 [candidate division KSB1 bacterium]|nr:hypothetical protein [candidate division KSB1 bacterium]